MSYFDQRSESSFLINCTKVSKNRPKMIFSFLPSLSKKWRPFKILKKKSFYRCFFGKTKKFKTLILTFFFYLGFLWQPITNHRTAGEGRGYFFNSPLPLPSASQTLRQQPGDYCRELTSAHIGSSRNRIEKLWFPSANR